MAPGPIGKTLTGKLSVNGTDLVHGDAFMAGSEVAPSISVSTTFRFPHPSENAVPYDDLDPRTSTRHEYSRYTTDVTSRAEQVLSKINDGFALTYRSGLAAGYAALLALQPTCIAITGGYHGCHAFIEIYRKTRDNVKIIGIDDDYPTGEDGKRVLCWLETPLNPNGDSRDIKYYADKVHKFGGKILIDSTFAPPPLQYPFKWGADVIMHSGSKYFGGHSDLLSGVLVVKTLPEWNVLWNDRTYTGSMPGSMESWLLLRSLRTLHLRVPRQSESATIIAQWLAKGGDGIPEGVVAKVWHSSIQEKDERGWLPNEQMEGGWNATFSILLSTQEQAQFLPHSLEYFIPATSLGCVDSLIEHRLMSDPESHPCLVRISVGVEDVEDLKDDLRRGLQTVSKKAQAEL
ncbi:cystathionine gamma-synthase [Athelia psychrophila]|uniref:Cystathionine gamma-synthase n=1 Tax=Athelia psychrophila TaxID=1759441 RepID=A0A166QEA8_9AGAM|nr:cystathionine gamma-synthase [Fibularhizoctonia sp. CBS 109695]